MGKVEKGAFFGVGVGPGDPELLTRKACRVLESCPVIAAVKTPGGQSLALSIVSQVLDLSSKEILFLPFSMDRSTDVRESCHREAVEQVLKQLRQGCDVAMVVLGDVSLYASFSYLSQPVRQAGFEVVSVPGITSFCAAAARLGISLTSMDEPLTIIPVGSKYLEGALDLPGTKVLMKPAGKVPDIQQVLGCRNFLDRVGIVVDCGLPGERVLPEWPEDSLPESYFTTFIIGPKKVNKKEGEKL